jgi:hypothetical protein
LPSKNPTDEIGDGELATTSKRARGARHAPLRGVIQVTVGRFTTSRRMPRNREFGIGFEPSVLMFFVSWKSEAKIRMNDGPAASGRTSRGNEKTAIPVCWSYEKAPSWFCPERSRSDSGSTPEAASRMRATMVGRPADTRRVTSWMFGGLTSLTQDRSVYRPASERPVNRSRPESTET